MRPALLSHEAFGALRLGQFRPSAEIAELRDWEFMDATWVGEAVGFSEWLRLESEPGVLRSLALDFNEFPAEAASQVLAVIGLPLAAGMGLDDVVAVLGEPIEVTRFVADRASYDFVTDGPEPYLVSCTLLAAGGLSYLVVKPHGES